MNKHFEKHERKNVSIKVQLEEGREKMQIIKSIFEKKSIFEGVKTITFHFLELYDFLTYLI